MSAQYQIPNGTKSAKGNELGIFQGLNQHYSQEDLDTYFKYIAPYACLPFLPPGAPRLRESQLGPPGYTPRAPLHQRRHRSN